MPRATKNLHVPLPEELHAQLHSAAEHEGRPATEIAREAIRRWIDSHRRALRRAAVAEYAAAMAGTGADLDPDLERAAVEHLRDVRGRKKRPR
ncbi:MAG: hypothetical protein M9894_36375 [Planctomycetes bacterium]|nr:hypothetical protein [Planctomycetota bacterium]